MAASAALFVSLIAPAPTAVRFLLAVVFVVIGPGTAILVLVGERSFVTLEVGLIIAVGIATTVLTAESLLWIGVFDPRPQAAIAAAAVFVALAVAGRQTAPDAQAGGENEAQSGKSEFETVPQDRKIDAGRTAAKDVFWDD
jgi:hypothetical protein